MTEKYLLIDLDQLVEDQLNLQAKISYELHHDFLLRHGLKDCTQVLDIGTGNGEFVSRLSLDHPKIQFIGIDKRKYCIDSSQKKASENLGFQLVDMFSRASTFDFSAFDGFLMRYFLLHVDHSHKIMELLKSKTRAQSKIWIIDLDFSKFTCEPHHPSFDKLIGLVKDFCQKKSIDSLAGQRILPIMENLDYQNIVVENIPFSTKTMALEDLTLYLKQEILCYSIMSGRAANDFDTSEIIKFLDEEVSTGNNQVSYGMILLSADS
jgi:hypothetical protein